MYRQWKVRIIGQVRKEPDVALLAQAVLLLAEQLQREREAAAAIERDANDGPADASQSTGGGR